MRSQATSSLSRVTGSVLLECMVAAGLVAMVMAALATTASVSMGMLRAQRETIASTQLLQERLESLRAGGWSQITSATALRDDILLRPSLFRNDLIRPVETITVTTYPPVSPAPTPLVVNRNSNGSASIASEPPPGFSLRSLAAVRVDLRVEWISKQNARLRSRETSAIISAGGLLK